jgi:AcrR family transcriptional regulator
MTTGTNIKEDIIQEQILQAAKQLFSVHGLHKVTMDDVAKAIGKGRSSLYYYYKSKDEILNAVTEAEIREMLAAVTRAINASPNFEQKLQAFFITKLNILREKGSFYNKLDAGMDADAMSDFNKAKRIHHNNVIKQESALLNEMLTLGMETGELRAINEKEKQALVFVLLSTLHGLKREMIAENNFEGIELIVTAFVNMTIKGLRE